MYYKQKQMEYVNGGAAVARWRQPDCGGSSSLAILAAILKWWIAPPFNPPLKSDRLSFETSTSFCEPNRFFVASCLFLLRCVSNNGFGRRDARRRKGWERASCRRTPHRVVISITWDKRDDCKTRICNHPIFVKNGEYKNKSDFIHGM